MKNRKISINVRWGKNNPVFSFTKVLASISVGPVPHATIYISCLFFKKRRGTDYLTDYLHISLVPLLRGSSYQTSNPKYFIWSRNNECLNGLLMSFSCEIKEGMHTICMWSSRTRPSDGPGPIANRQSLNLSDNPSMTAKEWPV